MTFFLFKSQITFGLGHACFPGVQSYSFLFWCSLSLRCHMSFSTFSFEINSYILFLPRSLCRKAIFCILLHMVRGNVITQERRRIVSISDGWISQRRRKGMGIHSVAFFPSLCSLLLPLILRHSPPSSPLTSKYLGLIGRWSSTQKCLGKM